MGEQIMKNRRVFLKLSGEALAGEQHRGLDFTVIQSVCAAIRTCLSFFEGELSRAEAGSTAWLVAAAHVVDGWCEEMAEGVGEEWEEEMLLLNK